MKKMTLKDSIKTYICNHPGATLHEVAEALKDKYTFRSVGQSLYDMCNAEILENKGTARRAQYHLTSPVKVAVANPAWQGNVPAKKSAGVALSHYTPRELLEELKKRGFVWDRMWVEERKYVEFSKI